jgi:hypothetical protein
VNPLATHMLGESASVEIQASSLEAEQAVWQPKHCWQSHCDAPITNTKNNPAAATTVAACMRPELVAELQNRKRADAR